MHNHYLFAARAKHIRVCGLLLVILMSFFSALHAHAQASIATDKPDYPPGSTVIITGSGFQANESITMQVLVIDPLINDNLTAPDHRPYAATADANGDLHTTWTVPLNGDEAYATLKATADGQLSGLHAYVVFTDAPAPPNLTSASITSPSGSATYGAVGQSITYTVSAIRSTSGNESSTLSISGLPSGVTAAFSPLSLSFNSNTATASSILTLTIATTAAATTSSSFQLVLSGSSTGSSNSSKLLNGTFTINPKAVTITPAANQSKIYGNADPTYTYTNTALVGTDALTGALGRVAGTNAGSYAYTLGTLSAGSNYSLSLSAATLFAITARSLIVTFTGVNKGYDGGTAATLALSDNHVSGDVLATAYTASFANKNVGTNKTVNVTGISISGTAAGNYNLPNATASTTANITTRALAVSAAGVSKAYDGLATATVNLSDDRVSGDVLTTSYTAASFVDKNVGTAKAVSITGITLAGTDAGNYTANTTASTTADITARSLTITADAKTKVYGTADPALTYTVTSGSLVGTDVLTGSLSRAAGTDVGTYAIGSGLANTNYALTYVPANLSITQAPQTISWSAPAAVIYGTALSTAQLNASVSGVSGGTAPGALTYAPAAGAVLGAGTQTLSVSAAATTNYTAATASVSLVVNKATPTLTWSAPAAIGYGTALTAAQLNASSSVAGAFAYTPAAGTVLNAGTSQALSVAFAPSDAANYTAATTTTSLTVNQAALTVTADSKTKVYGDATPALTVSYAGFVNGESAATLATAPAASTTATALSPVVAAGYPITAAGGVSANYSFGYTAGTLTISQRVLVVTAAGINKTYDGTATAAVALSDNRVSGDVLATSYSAASFGNKNVGTAKPVSVSGISIAGAAAGNYSANATASTSANITPATLTITAPSISRAYGDANPATFPGTYAGQQPGETFVVGGTAAATATSPISSASASYSIVPTATGATMGNYTVVPVAGVLTITARPITVTADSKTKTYGGPDPALTYLSSSLIGADAFSGSLSRTGTNDAGTYSIVQNTLSAGGNYAITFVGADFTISKGTPVVTANSVSFDYTGTQHPGSGSVAGTDLTNPAVTLSYVGTNGAPTPATGTAPVAAGTYTATATFAETANYHTASGSATLTINKIPLTITADNKSKTYDGSAYSGFTYTATGFVPNESSSVISGSIAYGGPGATAVAASATPYALTPIVTGLTATNYSFSPVDGTLTITPAGVTVTATGGSFVYDANPHAGTATAQGANGENLTAALTLNYVGTTTGGVSYNATGAPTQAGAYTVTATYAATANFLGASDSKALTIGKANQAITWAAPASAITYGTALSAAQLNAATSGDGALTYAPALGAVLDPGTLQLTVTAAETNNYNLASEHVALIVDKKTLTPQVTAASRDYDGTTSAAVAPQPLTGVVGSDVVLLLVNADPAKNTFDTESVGNGKTVTAADLSLGGANSGKYLLSATSATALANITRRALTVTATPGQRKVYGSADPAAFVYSVTAGSLASGDALDGLLSRDAGTSVGAYPILPGTLTIKKGAADVASNYDFALATGATFAITQLGLTISAAAKSKVYGDPDPGLTYALTNTATGASAGLVGTDVFAGTLSRPTGATSENVGAHAIASSLSAGTNYNLSYVAEDLTITARPLTVTATPGQGKEYGSAELAALTYFISSGSLAFSDAFAGSLHRASGEDVNAYPVDKGTLTIGNAGTNVAGNYTFTLASGAVFTISAKSLVVTAAPAAKTYGTANPGFTVGYSGFIGGESPANLGGALAFTTSATTTSAVGTYAVTPGGLTATNYAIRFIGGLLTVTQATPTVTATGGTFTYTGNAWAGSGSATGVLDPADALPVTLSYEQGATTSGPTVYSALGAGLVPTDAGTYRLTVAVAASTNYVGWSTTAAIVINKAPATLTLQALTQTYSGTARLATVVTSPTALTGVSVVYNNDPATAPVDAADYASRATLDNPNYAASPVAGTLRIEKAPQTIAWSAPAGITYGTVLDAAQLNATVSGVSGGSAPGGLSYTPAAGALLAAGLRTLTVDAAGTNNYLPASATVSVNVSKAQPVLAWVPAGSIVYGTSLAAKLGATSSFNNAPVAGQFGYEQVATASAVGPTTVLDAAAQPYALRVSFTPTDTDNYLSATAQNSLTVTPALLTVANTDRGKVYGTSLTGSDFAGTLTGVVNNDNITVTRASLGAVATAGAANYPIQGTLVDPAGRRSNYTVSNPDGTLTVSKALLTVTADGKSRIYGDANPAFTATITGFQNGQGLSTSDVQGAPDLGTTAGNTSPVGTYAISAAGPSLTSTNYSFSFVPGTLTVGQRVVGVTANANQTKVYGSTELALLYAISSGSRANGDTFQGQLARTTGTNVGSYDILLGDLSLGSNYTLTLTPGSTFAITPKALTPAISASNKVYDGSPEAVVAPMSLAGLVGGDQVFLVVSVVNPANGFANYFANKNVGNAKTATATNLSLSGTLAGNYALSTTTATTTANITARPLTVTAAGINRVYDGTTTATVTLGDNRVAGDGFTTAYGASFADKNVGTGKAVNVSSITIAGTDAGNYLANSTVSTTADITARPLNVTGAGVNKVYDGTATAAVTLSDNRVSGDVFATSYTAAFNDKNVGTAKPVSVSGIAITTGDAGNYALSTTTATTTANITARPLMVTATAANKVYDGSATATVALFDNRLPGDVFTVGKTSATFSDANAATNKTVTVSGIYLTGPDAGNYNPNPTATTTANITPQNSFPVADTYYTGASFYWTTNSTSSNATLTLVASLQNNPNLGSGNNGDIRTAKVSFFVRGNGGTLTPINGAQNLLVGLVTPSVLTTGTASTTVQYSISGSSALLDIAVVVSGNFTANDATTDKIIQIAVPTPGGMIAGCGALDGSNSAGYVKGASAVPSQFGFNVQYSKSLRNPQGAVEMTVKSYNDRYGNPDINPATNLPVVHTYRLKSNAISTLATTFPTAQFTSKANISELVGGVEQSIEGNCIMQLDMFDGNPDQLAVTVYRNGGGIWYSSRWDGSKTLQKILANGSLTVSGTATTAVRMAPTNTNIAPPQNQNASNGVNEAPKVRIEATSASNTLLELYPNPMTAQGTVHFHTEKGGKVQLYLYNQLGALMDTLYNAEVQSGQEYYVPLKTDELAAGVYLCRLISNGKVENQRINIVR